MTDIWTRLKSHRQAQGETRITDLFDADPARARAFATQADGLVLNAGGVVALLFSVMFMLFEMFIGALQAYIFTILTAQYISSSISDGH